MISILRDSFTLVSSLLSQSLKLVTSIVTGNRSLVILALLLHEVLVALLLQLLISIERSFLLLSLVGLLADSVLTNFGHCSCSNVVRSSSTATAREWSTSLALKTPSSVNFAELFVSFNQVIETLVFHFGVHVYCA